MSAAADKFREKLRKLFALLGSSNPHERETARHKIDELLARNKKTWNDLTELLSTGNTAGWRDQPDDGPGDGVVDSTPSNINALDLVEHVLKKYVHLTAHQYVAVSLWIAHTFVFERFSVTPRLALESPVRGCGKTTTLAIISRLAAKPKKADHITAAAIFRLIDRERPTLLLDEVDNLDLRNNAPLRSVINSGHRRGGKTVRVIDGEVVEFSTYAPMAMAVIGKLPLPILHRCIVIRMERDQTADLERFDELDNDQKEICDVVYRELFHWARRCKLKLNPPMSEELHDRRADNWRPLLSIADTCGPAWGERAREAAIAMSKDYQDEDFGVTLLSDIRDIFDRRPTVDRLASKVIVDELIELPDGLWNEWRGPRDEQAPRRLTQGQLALLLKPFDIQPRTIWPLRRGVNGKSARGYYRHQFARAWAAYCPGADTPTQRSNVKHLREP